MQNYKHFKNPSFLQFTSPSLITNEPSVLQNCTYSIIVVLARVMISSISKSRWLRLLPENDAKLINNQQ